MAYLNLTASIITLNVENQTLQLKDRDYENGLKRHSLNRETTDSLKVKD